jgi:serine/threonine protein kinase
MRQLCDTTTYLESEHYAHGDIWPENLLVEREDHLKLVDLDYANNIDLNVQVAKPPYVRVHGFESRYEDNSIGTVGPKSEQFAIGSTFHYMIEEHETYGSE